MAIQRSNSPKDNDLIFNRLELAWISFLYPGWSIFLKLFFPDTFDILWHRFIFGGLFLLLFITSHFNTFAKKHVNVLFYLLMNLLFVHYFYLMYMSSFSIVYVMGCLIVSTVTTLVIFRVIPYVIISINSLICASTVIYLSDGPRVYSIMLILGLISIQMTSLIILRSRARTENLLTETQAQLKMKNKDLATNLNLITTQKKDLEKANGDLEKVNRELDRYVHTVSHDIRSPLMGISGYTDLLKENLKEDMTPKRQHFLDGALRGVQHLNVMIDDLLRTTKITRIHNPYEKINMNTLIDNIKQRLAFKIKKLHVDLIAQADMPEIVCDRIKLNEVFQNLISNAIKYSSKNTPPRIEINYIYKDNMHEFCVKDNGIGIKKQHHEEIFGMFKSFNQSKENKSSGVGLTIVQKIIQDHGGRVWVESKKGAGSEFYFTIPDNLQASS